MKKFITILKLSIVLPAIMLAASCGPNDDKGGMDTENSQGEGALDTSRQTPAEGGRVDTSTTGTGRGEIQ
ncbi:MAG: hypothetical protein JWQ96_93 [Segetibacter sp.]|nr:hypothetical protein [Segetibacter sp.]